MNALLWIVQVVVGVQAFAGGLYKIVSFDEIASMPQMGALPRGAWTAIGVFEMLCGVLLIAPALVKGLRRVTPAAATALALESLALAALYASYSIALTAANPMVWVIAAAVMAAVVAYGRSRASVAHPTLGSPSA